MKTITYWIRKHMNDQGKATYVRVNVPSKHKDKQCDNPYLLKAW